MVYFCNQNHAYLNGKTSDNSTQGMPRALKQMSAKNKMTGNSSFLSVNVSVSQEKTVGGRFIRAQMLMAMLQQAVPSMEPTTSFLFPINLTIAADSKLITMNRAPMTTWKLQNLVFQRCIIESTYLILVKMMIRFRFTMR